MSPLMMEPYSAVSSPKYKPRSLSFGVSNARYDDIRRLVDIEFFAFENEKTNHILSYRDHNQPAHFQRAVRSYQAALSRSDVLKRRMKARSPHRPLRRADIDVTRFRKVTDAESGQIISWAKTETKAYTVEELKSPADAGHEGEAQMNRDWFALNERLRRDYMSTRRHCYIGMVATQPSFQHRGAGTMLLRDILDEADEAGIECYLEATDTAKPLYERHGFVTVNEIRFDPSAYGICGYKIERQTIMVRGALDLGGCRKEVRPWNERATRTSSTAADET